MALLAIDIGGSAIKYGQVSKSGEILKKGSVPNQRLDLETFLDSLWSIIDKNIKLTIEGIALSIPAIMNPKTGMIISEGSMPFLVGVNLNKLIEDKYHIRVHSENDGNCGALAEVWLGAGKACSDVAMIVIGTGVGGAVIKNRSIHPGANFIAGEFGYFISDYDFEKKDFKIWSETGAVLSITESMYKKTGRTLSGIEIFDLEKSGDSHAIEAIKSFFQSTAVGLFNIQYFYDPECIIIGGAVSSRQDFISRVEKELLKIYEVIDHAPVRPTLKRAYFGNDANLIGAVYNYLQAEGHQI